MAELAYCASRYRTVRRPTREVRVGTVALGAHHPVRIQSMTTTPTLDVAATVRQTIALAEAGCEIVRITAQNVEAARALGAIRRELRAARVEVPLVADIHFLPAAALEAAEHVDKVRINPGNYADKKKFAVREYSDALYREELERLHQAFSPIVRKCRDLGRAMRIGTNHGSLSDRILNRYGDTPRGMCESALEFLRIAADHGYRDIVVSMKASNPKVMIEAYRLMAALMDAEGLPYPLHLGVTEAGDGDDARIKSAIGIGTLLADGLGDTLRVSLTEDPVEEIPVARALARLAEQLWRQGEAAAPAGEPERDSLDPYTYARRAAAVVELGSGLRVGLGHPPAVVVALPEALGDVPRAAAAVQSWNSRQPQARAEGLLVRPARADQLAALPELRRLLPQSLRFLAVDLTALPRDEVAAREAVFQPGDAVLVDLSQAGLAAAAPWVAWASSRGLRPVLAVNPGQVADLPEPLPAEAVATLAEESGRLTHPLGRYRQLAEALRARGWEPPLWIRTTAATRFDDPSADPSGDDLARLLEASLLAGGLLCDGLGDLLSVELEAAPDRSVRRAYDILQGARLRSSKTEFVACPSCGRTLFDLQSTTQLIRQRTGHLQGVTIAVMGCIVNGPGEMADADFGYVGGAPGRVNLYVGRTPVEFNIPAAQAVDRLVELIRSRGRWRDPETVPGPG